MNARAGWPLLTVQLEHELSREAVRRGMTVLELAKEKRRASDSPVRCGQLDAIIAVRSREAGIS